MRFGVAFGIVLMVLVQILTRATSSITRVSPLYHLDQRHYPVSSLCVFQVSVHVSMFARYICF